MRTLVFAPFGARVQIFLIRRFIGRLNWEFTAAGLSCCRSLGRTSIKGALRVADCPNRLREIIRIVSPRQC